MKAFLSSALAAGLLLFFIASCNNDNRNARDSDDYGNNGNNKTKKIDRSIVGKWEPIDMEGEEEMTEEERNDLLENTTIEFTRDGRYRSASSDKRESGDYTYDERNRLLTTTTESGRKEELKISWIKDKLVLTLREGEEESKITMRRIGSKVRDDDDDRDTDDAGDYASGSSITGKWRMVNMGKRIEFRRNGNYVATSDEDEGEDEHGTYTYDKSTKILETISENGEREDFDVEFRGNNKIILTYDKGKMTLVRD